MTMRAIVITRPGGPEVLELEERPTPEPGLGQVRVRIRASALNRADLSQRMGNYPAPPGAPADIPGLEYAGEVDAVGPSASMWPVRSRVMGIVGGGGHAEYVCVHEREVLPIPKEMSFEDAAAIPEVFLTAYDALFRQLDVRLGERVLVHAIGSGVGTAALQLAWLAGGVVLVETLFAYPGVGRQLVDSVRNHDVPMVQALSMIIAGVYIVVNLVADVLSILLTPRARTAISS